MTKGPPSQIKGDRAYDALDTITVNNDSVLGLWEILEAPRGFMFWVFLDNVWLFGTTIGLGFGLKFLYCKLYSICNVEVIWYKGEKFVYAKHREEHIITICSKEGSAPTGPHGG